MSDEWQLPDCRRRVRELEASLREVGGDQAATAQALMATRLLVERQRLRIHHLEAERDAAEERARVACAELAECKRQGEAGGTRLATTTPLLPRKP